MKTAGTAVPVGGLLGLYRELRPELLRFLTARLGDAGEAEDVAQDLWLRLRAASGRPVGNGRAYLFRAAQNLVLDRVRDRRRRMTRDHQWLTLDSLIAPTEGTYALGGDAEASLAEAERTDRLAAAIAVLPAGAGRVFRLHKLEGMPHAEIARQLGISRSGVEKHLALAMAHLRRSLLD